MSLVAQQSAQKHSKHTKLHKDEKKKRKHEKREKRRKQLRKEMRKMCIVLRRLNLPRHDFDWVESLHSEARDHYKQLQRLCAQFMTSHRDTDPLRALYRYSEASFTPLSAAHAMLDADGKPLRKQLSEHTLRKLVSTQDCPATDHASRLYWLYEQRNNVVSSTPPDFSALPTSCLLTLDTQNRRAYYSVGENSEALWGPVMVLREPRATVDANLTALRELVESMLAVIKTTSAKQRKQSKRARTADDCKELQRIKTARVLVLDKPQWDSEEEARSDDATLGSEDSVTDEADAPPSELEDSYDSDDDDDANFHCESDDYEEDEEEDDEDDEDSDVLKDDDSSSSSECQ